MSAGKVIRLSVYTSNIAGECPDCRFDALRRVRAYELLETGVTTRVDKTLCGRCKAEEKRGQS